MSFTHPRPAGSAIRTTTVAAAGRMAAALLLTSVLAAGCGGGGGGSSSTTSPPPPVTYTIGGSISGLTGTGLVLQDNGGDNLSPAANATSFTFATALASGAAYAVTVKASPANQTCTVSNGSGTVAAANVTNVAVKCTTSATATYTIGGSISGLTASGLVLQDNGGDNLSPAANATSFTFATALASGAAYSVTVKTSPANQTCTVSNGSGTVAAANVTNVAVKCTAGIAYTIGGTVTGLAGTGLTLQDNAGDNLTVPPVANGAPTTFTFATPLASGAAYAVTVLTQPTSPAQVCSVTNGTGTVAAANVTTVAISCKKMGQFVFVVNKNDGANGDVSGFAINPSSGTLSPMVGSPFTADATPTSVAVDVSGQFVYVANFHSADVSTFVLNVPGNTMALSAVHGADGCYRTGPDFNSSRTVERLSLYRKLRQ